MNNRINIRMRNRNGTTFVMNAQRGPIDEKTYEITLTCKFSDSLHLFTAKFADSFRVSCIGYFRERISIRLYTSCTFAIEINKVNLAKYAKD